MNKEHQLSLSLLNGFGKSSVKVCRALQLSKGRWLAQIRSLGLLPTGLTGSAEIWLDHAEFDRLKVCPIIVTFAQAMTCSFSYFFRQLKMFELSNKLFINKSIMYESPMCSRKSIASPWAKMPKLLHKHWNKRDKSSKYLHFRSSVWWIFNIFINNRFKYRSFLPGNAVFVRCYDGSAALNTAQLRDEDAALMLGCSCISDLLSSSFWALLEPLAATQPSPTFFDGRGCLQ